MKPQHHELSRLFSLPEEILIHLLSLMHPTTLVTCRAVCKMLLNVIEQTTILNYHIELYADGMVDVEDCKLSAAERLSLLRSRRQAWRDIQLESRPFPLIPGTWNAYELVDGIFSKTLNTAGDNTARGILFASLPSRHDPGSLVTFDDLGITFRDFAMDPSQDLIVYMQCSRIADSSNGLVTHVTLHFRTMSNNKTHPRARQPTVSITFRSEVFGAVIQTVNDVVGFMSWDNSNSHLYMWDWTRCMQLVSQTHLAALDDFAFISDRAFVLTSPGTEPCFRLYTFDTNPNLHGSHMSSPTLRATLYLPDMCPGASARLLGIHTGPFTSTASQLLRPQKPFVTSPQARIHVINIDLISRSTEHAFSFLIVIRNETFISYLNEVEPLQVPWEGWGPHQTRWIRGGTGSLWLRYVHGERLVRLQAAAADGSRYLEMYDFGAPRGPPSWRTPQEDILMHRTSAFKLNPVFESSVKSQLPCRVTTKWEIFPYSGFMVDEDRLIGLKRHWDDEATSVDVFTF